MADETKPLDTKFEYKVVTLDALGLDIVDAPVRKSGDEMTYIHGGQAIRAVVIDGEPIVPTGRFWSSLYSKYQINNAFFRFFKHSEVFKRIGDTNKEPFRVCVERSPNKSRLLAVTGMNKPAIIYDDLMEILQGFNLHEGVKYHDGVVSSTHVPLRSGGDFNIGGDKYSNRFVMHTPVDGYGNPNVYLSLLRWICSNGAVGFANTFKTALALGTGDDSIQYTMRRALEAFSNDEGYSLLRDRFTTAMKSWASIKEQQSLYSILLKLQNDNVLRSKADSIEGFKKEDLNVSVANALVKSFGNVTGSVYDLYGVSDPNLMSPKKQASLRVGCKVYDLLNFATELATHHVSESNARQLQAWVGQMLSKDFDLEDSCDAADDWRALFLSDNKVKSSY